MMVVSSGGGKSLIAFPISTKSVIPQFPEAECGRKGASGLSFPNGGNAVSPGSSHTFLEE